MKVSLLQDSFVREMWNHVGKQIYLEAIHPLVILNLLNSPHKSSASAAAVLLIGSSEELGVPISVQQVSYSHVFLCFSFYGLFVLLSCRTEQCLVTADDLASDILFWQGTLC